METLDSLKQFTEEYPQEKDGKLQYVFLGGTAVRLHQEAIKYPLKRDFQDFDLLVFEGKDKYPVDKCFTDNIFGNFSSTPQKLARNVTSTRIAGKEYFFIDAAFLALLKTCVRNSPREKDFTDVQFLFQSGLINLQELDSLYHQTPRLDKGRKTAAILFEKILKNPNEENTRIFQAFISFANLIGEFTNIPPAYDIVSKYITQDTIKIGHGLNSAIYDSSCLVRELGGLPEIEKLEGLTKVLKLAKENDYVQFDRMIHERLIPQVKYGTIESKRKVLATL